MKTIWCNRELKEKLISSIKDKFSNNENGKVDKHIPSPICKSIFYKVFGRITYAFSVLFSTKEIMQMMPSVMELDCTFGKWFKQSI